MNLLSKFLSLFRKKRALQVRIKRLSSQAQIPKYAKLGDAALDLIATSKLEHEDYVQYGTDLQFEIPENYVGLIFPRSSISNYSLRLANSVGVIDSGYRGEVTFRFKKPSTRLRDKVYNVGDKIGQIIILPYPQIEFVEAEELNVTIRGSGGYGSSGN